MKRLLFTILLFTAALPAAAQLYHPGEQLFYRVSYKAKMFPNTEVGAVEVKTSEVQLDDRKFYKVEGIGRTLPTYRWFFNLEDIYTVWISPETLRPVRFESDLKEGDYTFQSYYTYDWDNDQVHYPVAAAPTAFRGENHAPDSREHGCHRAFLHHALGQCRGFQTR